MWDCFSFSLKRSAGSFAVLLFTGLFITYKERNDFSPGESRLALLLVLIQAYAEVSMQYFYI